MSMEKFDDQLYGDQQFKNRPKAIYQAYARVIAEIFNPDSILDLGCANGYALAWWQKQKIKISGLEPARAAFTYMPKTVQPFVKQLDLRQILNLKPAEVVNFTEVAEHIDKKYETIMLNNVINSVKKYLIISWSNEANVEHVNPQPENYVRKKLQNLGLFFEPELTQELKQKLLAPDFKDWTHWSKYILVFSRLPQSKRVLIRHFEWLESYKNKNIGYFCQAARKLGLGPRWTQNDWKSLFKRWHCVWLYPFEKHLLIKLLILKLFGNKIILKMDSVIFPRWRARLVKQLADYILVESTAVAAPFEKSVKLVYFSGGLPQKNIDLIKTLKIKREKIILYSGRPTYQKGIDRLNNLKKSLPHGWQLKIVSNLSGKDYYTKILKSSIVILPTRGEGWPNVFQDAWFCQRLFLTTDKAQCSEGILNRDFYVSNLKSGLTKIIDNLDWYYRHYDQLYDQTKFVQTDKVFCNLLTNQG